MERYMMVYYYQKPNGKWDEITEFKNRINNTAASTAKVILDFKERKCVKNGLNPEAGFDDMLEFYKRMLGDKLTARLAEEFK